MKLYQFDMLFNCMKEYLRTVNYTEFYKVIVKLSLSLTKHPAVKTYWGSRSIALHILNLCVRWSRVVSFTPRRLYSQGKAPGTNWIENLVGPKAGQDAVVDKESHHCLCRELNPDRLARSLVTILTELPLDLLIIRGCFSVLSWHLFEVTE
jgi:hypothetical protein